MYADIQIVTEGYYDIINGIDSYNYTSKLLVQNITLDSPYTKFKCEVNNTFKEISFKVKGKRNFDSFDANKELTNRLFLKK